MLSIFRPWNLSTFVIGSHCQAMVYFSGTLSSGCSMFQLCRSPFTPRATLLVQSVAPVSCAMQVQQQQESRAVTRGSGKAGKLRGENKAVRDMMC